MTQKVEVAINIVRWRFGALDKYSVAELMERPDFKTEFRKTYDLVIDALKKQEAMKPIGEHYAHMRCPSCDHRIPSGMGSSSRRRDNWCNYCGQKILWVSENG